MPELFNLGKFGGGIVRVERNTDNPWVTVEKALTEDRRLSFALRGMLVYLLGKPPSWQVVMQSIENASDVDGEDTIRSLFREGRAAGYVVTGTYREKGRIQYVHTVFERPITPAQPGIIEYDPGTGLYKPNRTPPAGYGEPGTAGGGLVSNEQQVMNSNTDNAARSSQTAANHAGPNGGKRSTPAAGGPVRNVSPAKAKAHTVNATGGENVPAAAARRGAAAGQAPGAAPTATGKGRAKGRAGTNPTPKPGGALTGRTAPKAEAKAEPKGEGAQVRAMLAGAGRASGGLGFGLLSTVLREVPAREQWFGLPLATAAELIAQAKDAPGNKKTALIRALDVAVGLAAPLATTTKRRPTTTADANMNGARRAAETAALLENL